MKVYISILNYNGRENTIECVNSLEKLKHHNMDIQIIVIDNASKEEISEQDVKLKNIPVIFLKNKENLGFAGGHNVGFSYALKNDADYIVILNNDTFVHEDLILELVTSAEKDQSIGVVAPKIYFAPGSEYHKDRYKKEDLGKVFWYAGGEMDWKNLIGKHRGVDEVDNGQYDIEEITESASGCCMLIRREVLEKVKLFDDRYFLYYEDSDLQERIKSAGYKIMYAPKAVLWHKNAGSSGGSGSVLQDYYISRNRMLFGFLYAPSRTKLALMKESLKIYFTGREWQKKGVRDFYQKKFGKGSFISKT